jgi:hypothetical protein
MIVVGLSGHISLSKFVFTDSFGIFSHTTLPSQPSTL